MFRADPAGYIDAGRDKVSEFTGDPGKNNPRKF